MEEYFIAWWNVENLFDVEGQVEPHRPDYLQKQLAGELEGWTEAVLNKKIAQLIKIIGQMNNNNGPDLLGICEVENEKVVTRLMDALQIPGRDYDIVHHDTKDKRGIDIAFIFDKNKFAVDPGKTFNHTIQLNYATRELYQVTFTTKANNQFVVIGNHWPSRLGEEWARLAAGAALGYWVRRINEELGQGTPILAMGDFNDEPFNDSLVKPAQSVQFKTKVTKATKTHYLFNPMWKPLGEGRTSYVYNNTPNMLDQFLVSKGLIKTGLALRYKDGSADVLRFPEMETGVYKKPKRFGRPSSKASFDLEGFSDHFPIKMILQES